MNVIFVALVATALPYQHGDADRKSAKAEQAVRSGIVSGITDEYQDHFVDGGTLHSKLRGIRMRSMHDDALVAEQLESRAERAFRESHTIDELTKVVCRFDGTQAAEKAKHRLGVIYLDRGLRETGLRLLGDRRDPQAVPEFVTTPLEVGPLGKRHEVKNYGSLRPDWDGLCPEVSQIDYKRFDSGVLLSSRTGVYFEGAGGTVMVESPSTPMPTFGYDFHREKITVEKDPPMLDDAPAQFTSVDHHTAIFSLAKNQLYGINELGKRVWESPKQHKGKPAVFGKKLVAITEDRYCLSLDILDPETGNVEWSQPFASMMSTTDAFPLEPTIDASGIAYCPTDEGAIVAIDLALRQLKWFGRYEATSTYEPSLPRLTFNRMVVNDRVWCLPSDSEMLLCFDLDGNLLHSFPRQDTFEILGCDTGVIRVSGFGCTRMDNECQTVWTTDINRVSGTSVEDKSRVLVPCEEYIAILDKSTGESIGSYPVDERLSLRVVDGELVYCGENGVWTASAGPMSPPVDYEPIKRGTVPVAYLTPKEAVKEESYSVKSVEVASKPSTNYREMLSIFSLPRGCRYKVAQAGTTANNRLVFTDQTTEEVLGEFNIKGRITFPNWTPVDPIDVIPVATSSEIMGLNPLESDKPVWTFSFDGNDSLPIFGPYGDNFCVFRTQRKMYNIDTRTGALIWSRDVTPDLSLNTTCLFGDSNYLVFLRTYTLYSVYNMQTGEEIEAGRLPDRANGRTRMWGSRVMMSDDDGMSVWEPINGIIWEKSGKHKVATKSRWLIASNEEDFVLVDMVNMKEHVVPAIGTVDGCWEHNGITFVGSTTINDIHSNRRGLYSSMAITSADHITAIRNDKVIWHKQVGEVAVAGGYRGVLFNFYQLQDDPSGNRRMRMLLLRCSDGKTLYDEEIPTDNYISLHAEDENVILTGVNTTVTIKVR